MEASCHKRGVGNGGRSFRLETTPHPPQCAAEQCSALQGTFPVRGEGFGQAADNRPYGENRVHRRAAEAAASTAEDG